MFTKAIEILVSADNQVQAAEMAAALATQDGVTGVRVVGGHSKPYAAQGFMALSEGVTQDALPDAWNIRIVPEYMLGEQRL